MSNIEPISDEDLNRKCSIAAKCLDIPAPVTGRDLLAIKARLDATKAERDKYKAVVERLPKDAEGNHIIPWVDELFSIHGTCMAWYTINLTNPLTGDITPINECYISPEAAEQARRSFTNAEGHDPDKHDYTHWADDNEHGDR